MAEENQKESTNDTPPDSKESTNNTPSDSKCTVLPIDTGQVEHIVNDKKNIITNTTAIAGVVVNLVLAIFTYLLYKHASTQTQAAVNAARAANDAVAEAKRANDISDKSYKLSVEARSTDDSLYRVEFNLTKKSVEAQIKSIEENAKRFRVASRPYLQIGNVKVKQFTDDDYPVIEYDIMNLGVYPVKITSSNFGVMYKSVDPDMDIIDKIADINTGQVNQYISKEVTVSHFKKLDIKPSTFVYQGVILGKLYIYFFGYIYYRDLVTEKDGKYTFMIKIKPEGSSIPSNQAVISENEYY